MLRPIWSRRNDREKKNYLKNGWNHGADNDYQTDVKILDTHLYNKWRKISEIPKPPL